MQFPTLKTYLNWAKAHAPKGPFAFIFAQDDIELTHTVAHHIKLGFRQTLVLADVPFTRPQICRLKWPSLRGLQSLPPISAKR